ncbi:hypothetical protein IWW50_000121 [Coemansia erecta]|nr:hypothetical protein GGF43_000407 [Coemansia sp. RSA 2618]KAJ2830675.1 hypothetical protein IWW50_000121 [Coemansia erecta]
MPAFTVISAAGRRVTVRPSPSDTLQSVVAAACAQLPNTGNPESFALLHKDTELPLSTIVRLANLPQGATLELKPASQKASSSPVKVALQIVGSGRIIDSFSQTATLWDVLVAAETRSNGTLNLTSRFLQAERASGGTQEPASPRPAENEVVYQQPVVVLLNKEYAANDTLQATTLRSLGLTGGSAMLRLSFRDTPASISDLHRVASAASSPLASPKPQPPHTITAIASTTNTSTANISASAADDIAKEAPCAADQNHANVEQCTSADPAHNVRVFDVPPTIAEPLASRFSPLPELSSSEEARLVISAQRARQSESERGFQSRQAQEAEAKQRRAEFAERHPTTTIRFRFPDQVQVQAAFASTSRVSELYTFIRGALRDPRLLRALVLRPPVEDLHASEEKTLLCAKLTPAAVVHVQLAGSAGAAPKTLELLLPSTSALAEPLDVAANEARPAQSPDSLLPPPPLIPEPSQSPSAQDAGDAAEPHPRRNPEKQGVARMPKWFLAGQKR